METNHIQKAESTVTKSKNKKRIILAVITISIALFGSFFLFFILQLTLNTETPVVVVESGSMEPVISRGDLLIVKGVPAIDIRNGTIEDMDGDIIVFNAQGVWSNPPAEPIVHRVVDKKFEDGIWQFKTKGDANPIVDEGWVPEGNILGVVVFKIPWIGWVKIFLTESGLLIPLLIIISALLVISIIVDAYKKYEAENTEKEDSNELAGKNNGLD
ncbi:MAG: signal peptidase I [Promethearchaeota archaeon]|nr:MAG: signal peptidase I [Candidatus Lokiarchaeota archaeon]